MENQHNNRRAIFLIAVVIIAVIVLAVVFATQGSRVETISYSDMMEGIQKESGDDKIIGIIFTGDYQVNVLYQKDAEKLELFKKGKYASATTIVTYRNALVLAVENLQADGKLEVGGEKGLYISLNNPNKGAFLNYLFPIIYVLLLVGVAVFIFISIRRNSNGNAAMGFGKTKARVANSVKVRFTDVAGAEEEKEELKEIVEFLKSPKKFRAVGARVPKGVLLVGQPGTGKTLFAKAVAGEANVPFFSISGSDFVEMFVGVGASRVRDLFQQAKKNQPCIVFIDEIDAVGRKRGAGLGGGNDEREQTLNQLLVQMDGFDEQDGVVIMAATNRVDVLDPALLRPGRFDRQVYVHMPDVKGREAILRVHARNKPIAPDIDFRTLARLTSGFSGADIENLLNESAILAARDNRQVILMHDIQEGINKVIAGPQKKSRVVTQKDKRITAYHEAGHALVGRMMKNCDDIQEVSIIPRGMAAGYTISRPKGDDSHVTKNRLNDEIAMMLGGRAAEELIIQDISTGASQDIKRATSTARSMVAEWGMSDALPNVFFGGEEEVFIGRDYQTQASYSNEVAAIIDTEIRKIIETNYERAKAILNEHMDVMHAMVRLLFEHETIYGEEIDMLMEGKSVEDVNAFIDEKRAEQERIAKEKAEAARRMEKPNPLGNPADFIIPEPKKEDEAEVKPEGEVAEEPKPEEPAEVKAEEPTEAPAEEEQTEDTSETETPAETSSEEGNSEGETKSEAEENTEVSESENEDSDTDIE